MGTHTISRGCVNNIHELLSIHNEVVIITDQNVQVIYDSFFQKLKRQCQHFYVHSIIPGESSKSMSIINHICQEILKRGFTRKLCIIAFGGGVVGDIGGFVSSIYHRGVTLYQIPTSLLAMVDSSTGGKTGVDTPYGKNTIGSFYPAKHVFVDPDLLITLPDIEYSNGMAEVIKMALTSNPTLLGYIENLNLESLRQDKEIEETVIRLSIETKISVVSGDPIESLDKVNTSSSREVLNFGHTVGHAIEALTMEKHGLCVAIGMARETLFKRDNISTPFCVRKKLLFMLMNYKLPTSVPKLSHKRICDLFIRDKKGGRMVTLKQECQPITVTPTEEEIKCMLSPQRKLIYLKKTNTETLVITPPGSKSVSNRLLIMAALGRGPCLLKGLLLSDDTIHMMRALQSLGVTIETTDQENGNLCIHGCNGILKANSNNIFLGNSGTSVRFLSAVCCACLVEGKNDHIYIDGDEYMHKRPVNDLLETLQLIGGEISSEGGFPLRIGAHSKLKGKYIRIPGNISSQFATGLLLALPFCQSQMTLIVVKDTVSRTFIDLTVQLMRDFGIHINTKYIPENGDTHYFLEEYNWGYNNPNDYQVEVDASSCFYPMALSSLTGQKIHIPNLFNNCKQGDAKLGIKYLRQQGVAITQDERGTICIPPERGICQGVKGTHVFDLDSSDITITVAVIASLMSCSQSIVNVANQNQKECRRLDSIVVALNRLGVDARQDNDTLDISGSNCGWWKSDDLQTVLLECKDDHRMAMSLSLLSIFRQNIVLDNIECVTKTYPLFWEMVKSFGISSEGIDEPLPLDFRIDQKKWPIVLVGCPGTGKTTLGSNFAQTKNVQWIDTDTFLSQKLGIVPEEYISKYSEQTFRTEEFRVLRTLLLQNTNGLQLISTGGGIVSDKRCLSLMSQLPCVIYLHRDIGDSQIDKVISDKAKLLGYTSGEDFFRQRDRQYQDISTHIYHLTGNTSYTNWNQWLVKLITPPKLIEHSLFLCLPFVNLEELSIYLEECSRKNTDPLQGCVAIECRADRLDDQSPEGVIEYLKLLIHQLDAPIIFTYRSKEEGGGNQQQKVMARGNPLILKLYQQAIKLGCSFFDWEVSGASRRAPNPLHSEAIASIHSDRTKDVVEGISCGWGRYRHLFDRCLGSKWRSKFVLEGGLLNQIKFQEGLIHPNKTEHTLVILKGSSAEAKISRCCNQALTPVSVDNVGGTYPTQLTASEVLTIKRDFLIDTGLIDKYYLFGSTITKSPSPTIHNQYFTQQYSYKKYQICETNDITYLLEKMGSTTCKGASVTMPFKEAIINHMDIVSREAKSIGAVNTLTRLPNGKWKGDNTDWMGVRDILNGHIINRPDISIDNPAKIPFGVVIGTGGVARACCYAYQQIGCNYWVVGRNSEKAKELADRFGAIGHSSDLSLTGNTFSQLRSIIICIPPEIEIAFNTDNVLNTVRQIHVIEQGYGSLLKRAFKTNDNIIVHSGLTVLEAQAKYQNLLWRKPLGDFQTV